MFSPESTRMNNAFCQHNNLKFEERERESESESERDSRVGNHVLFVLIKCTGFC